MTRRILSAFVLVLLVASIVLGQANGKLQIHFMDVGQGDTALLISPEGQTVLFDNGVEKPCEAPLSYLQQLGLTQIDYRIASHYHSDHIGCTREVLNAFPFTIAALDRGFAYKTQVFTMYREAISDKRTKLALGEHIVLDSWISHPVAIRFVAMNGADVWTNNENDRSLVAVVKFGKFDAVMGGEKD